MRAEQSRAERLPWIDILKGIGIILVVVGHIYSNSTIFKWLYSFHMPLFFFAAGWVYRERSVIVDIKRRIQTVVVPYFSFGILILIYWQVIERRFRDTNISFSESLLGLLLGKYDKLVFNVHLWFLPCFFVTVVLFNVIVNIGGKKTAYIVSILMSGIYIIFPLPGLPWGCDRVFKYIFFYAVGVWLAEHDEKINITYKNFERKILAIILLIVNFWLAYINLTEGIMWFITGVIGVGSIKMFAQMINENKFVQYFGRISLIILCLHGPVYRMVIKIVSISFRMDTNAVRENFFLVMVVVVVTMIVCSIIYEFVIRTVPWMLGKKKMTIF